MDIEIEDRGRGLTDDDIINIVSSELEQARTAVAEIRGDAETALDYYLGNARGDEEEGRSQIVSTDVADAIEWILPQVISSLVARGSIISFDAKGPDDEQQAKIETSVVHEIFTKDNEGFLNLHEYVKDALMQKNGIFKIYYDDTPTTCRENYSGLTELDMHVLMSDPRMEVVAAESIMIEGDEGVPLWDVEVEVMEDAGRIRIETVPPEDFYVESGHDSLDLSDVRFCAHTTLKTRSELVEEGYDKEIIYNTSDNTDLDDSSFRYESQKESTPLNFTEDESQVQLEVSECYIQIDIDKSGVSKLHKITLLGSEDPTDILDIEPIEQIPFVSSTAIIMSHKFNGLSIYDRLKQLQDQKTSLTRNIMDNLYLQNNREKEVVEGKVNIDDLLVSRPGGIKRVKMPNMIRELDVQPIGPEGYQMLDYLDQTRTGRVGVSPETAGQVDALGTAVGSEGVARLQTAKEALVGLMTRVIAETGLKQAYKLIRDLLIRHQDVVMDHKYRGDWIQVNPKEWGHRSRITVSVGTGTGDDQRKIGAIQQVIAYQAQLIADPRNTMVYQEQIYAALDEFCSLSGLSGADKYYLDPQSEEGKRRQLNLQQSQQQAQAQEAQTQQAMIQAQQTLAKAEQMKGQADLQAQQVKLESDRGKLQIEAVKQQTTAEKEALKLQLEQMKTELKWVQEGQKRDYDYAKLEQDAALRLTEMELQADRDASAQYQENKEQEARDV